MNFSAWSIRNPIPAVFLFIMLGCRRAACLQPAADPELSGHGSADHTDQCIA